MTQGVLAVARVLWVFLLVIPNFLCEYSYMRVTDRQRLRELVKAKGEKAVERVAVEANVSTSLLMRIMAGTYGRTPAKASRMRLCTYFCVSEDELFPLAPTKGKAQAS